MDLSEHPDDQRGEPDDDPAVGFGLLRIQDQPDGDGAQQYRHQEVEPSEGPGDEHLDEVADRTAQIRPGARGDDQREAQQQQRDAVLAVSGIEPLGAAPYAAEQRTDGVGRTEPDCAHQAVHTAGGRRRRFGRGSLLGHRLLGGGLLRGRGLPGSGLLRGRGFLRRARPATDALRGARRALGTLAGRT